MGFYPIFVEMQGRRVILVGGGKVAHEKISKLVDAEAAVTIVAPELIPAVREYVESGCASLIEREYRSGDVGGFEVVMIATDDGEVNRAVADEARAAGIWVNAADDVTNCDFILPSLVKRGNIAIATSTGGTSPALARWLRERMEEFLTDDVVALGDLLAEVRVQARERDHECAAGCELTRTAPPLLCGECPNRISPDRWQDAIDVALHSLRIAEDELRRAREGDGHLDDSLVAVARHGEYEQAKQRMTRALGIDQPLLARAAR